MKGKQLLPGVPAALWKHLATDGERSKKQTEPWREVKLLRRQAINSGLNVFTLSPDSYAVSQFFSCL